MEVQFTDFENASFSIFIVLVTRAILSYNLNFYIPISKVDENMKVAHHRNGTLTEKFWFRTDVFRESQDHSSNASDAGDSGSSSPDESATTSDTSMHGNYKQLSINEIINGSTSGFPGLIPIVRQYLQNVNVDMETLCILEKHLSLVSKRASGELVSNATWIRDYVRSHKSYKFDSVISPEIHFDLVKTIEKITNGEGWNTEGASILGGFSP